LSGTVIEILDRVLEDGDVKRDWYDRWC